MNVLLQFMFDTDNLRANVRAKWMEFYDYVYLDDKIIGGIEKNLPSVVEILGAIEKRATGKAVSQLSQSAFNEKTSVNDDEPIKKAPTV